jgi:hypothetical protein
MLIKIYPLAGRIRCPKCLYMLPFSDEYIDWDLKKITHKKCDFSITAHTLKQFYNVWSEYFEDQPDNYDIVTVLFLIS